MKLVVITGLSGSGKTVALAALEDAGFYCVDNLPVSLIEPLLDQLQPLNQQKVALVADSRSAQMFEMMPTIIQQLKQKQIDVRVIFLDARDEILIRRFSETRRKHPLVFDHDTLGEAIEKEREMFATLTEQAFKIDTSDIDPNTCRSWVKSAADIPAQKGLMLTIESFGFSRGIPLDADFVFDIRFIKNPHYDPNLRALTGQDQPVMDYLDAIPMFNTLYDSILQFIETWLPEIEKESRSYLTIAIGCTGGQHRSVYMAEKLAKACKERYQVVLRHRSLTYQQCLNL